MNRLGTETQLVGVLSKPLNSGLQRSWDFLDVRQGERVTQQRHVTQGSQGPRETNIRIRLGAEDKASRKVNAYWDKRVRKAAYTYTEKGRGEDEIR